MIKLSFLILFLLMGSYSLKADESLGGDQEFTNELDNIKNPFEDGLPKPVVIPKPVYHPEPLVPKLIAIPIPKPKPVYVPVVLPELKVQGVMVGDDMHEAIINDHIVPLRGYIQGVRLDSVSKEGVELFYKGKKFFLKVE